MGVIFPSDSISVTAVSKFFQNMRSAVSHVGKGNASNDLQKS